MVDVRKKVKNVFRVSVGCSVALFCLLFVQAGSSQTLDSLQRRLSEMRFGMFIHFNMNTYSPGWANARVNPLIFNPTNLDCGQWARAAKAAGMKYGVLTCKHHDGFTIWPCKQTPLVNPAYTIAQSSQPKMDVVRAYVDSFRVYGLEPGLYMSMFDVAQGISQSVTKWTPAQRSYILGQIHELLTNYGPVPIFMFDGYSWAMGHWAVPWQEIRDTIKALQPKCLVVETNAMHEPWETDVLFIEEPLGNNWIPTGNTYASIQGQTIDGRNWFWRAGMALYTVNDIVNTHLKALEAQYCTFQLNCPPNRTGQMDDAVVTLLGQVGAAWKPNTARPPLPKQFPMIEDPMTPVSATATSGTAFNVIDDVNDWYRSAGGHFQSLWVSSGALPQSVTLDLGSVYNNVSRLYYLPRRDSANVVGPTPTGYITTHKIYVSVNGTTFTQVTSGANLAGGAFGTWAGNSKIKRDTFPEQTARYIRLEATGVSGGTDAIISSLEVGGSKFPRIPVSVKNDVVNHTGTSPVKSNGLTIGRFVFDPALDGKEKQVALYDLSGKFMGTKTMIKNSFDVQKDFGIQNGAYIVKVKNSMK